MGIQERKSRQKGILRQEILDAARDLFAREGYESVTMRRIADQIEYSPTTIYLHFKDKAELLHQVCEDTFSQLADHIERIGDESDDPVTALKKGLRAYIDFGLAHPNHYRVTFDMPAHYTEMPIEEYFLCTQGGRAFNSLVQAVEVSVQSGRFPRSDVQLTSQVLWAAIHGVTSLLINHPDFPWADRDTLIDALIETTVKGLESA
jgi:AcrR family transcriptional regulator